MDKLSLPIKMAISIVICLGIGLLSGIATSSSIQSWYTTLNKPSFNPPNWLFAPAWTILYTLMGISVAYIWHAGWKNTEVKTAIFIFAAQLMLNAFWSVAFFGMQNPPLALAVILILWVLIFICIVRFKPIKALAAYLLIPYLLWVTFATVLNVSIILLN